MCIFTGSPARSMASDSARPRIARRTKFPDHLVMPPGSDRPGDQLVAEVQARIQADAHNVPAEMLQELRANVGRLAHVDPGGLGMERINSRLLRRVPDDRCEAEDVSSRTRPGHGARLLSRARLLIAEAVVSIRSFTVARAAISQNDTSSAHLGHNRLT